MLFHLSSAADQTPEMCLTRSFLCIIKPSAAAAAAAATACLPSRNPFRSSIFSEISLLGESTGQTLLRDRHFCSRHFWVFLFFLSTARDTRDGASVLISSELPGVIPAYCMCPDPETGCIPMPPRRLALKTQATVPTEAARMHSVSTGGGLWVDEFTPAAPELCSLCENARLLFVR